MAQRNYLKSGGVRRILPDSSTDELLKLYAMYERSMIYDWALCKGTYSLSQYSSRLLPHMLDTFIHGI